MRRLSLHDGHGMAASTIIKKYILIHLIIAHPSLIPASAPFIRQHPSVPSQPPPHPLIATVTDHYDELVSHVRHHARRRGGDTDIAHDVVHDVLLSLFETPPARPVNTPLAFLRSLLTRRAIDLHRIEAGRRKWVENVDTLPAHAVEADDGQRHALDPMLLLDQRQRVALLASAIHALPPRCRDVFVLHKLHQKPQAEVADWLGISLKTVEKHLRLGMAACREHVRQALQPAHTGADRSHG